MVTSVAVAEISPVVLTVRASNSQGAGEFQATLDTGWWDPNEARYTWNWSAAPLEIRDPQTNVLIARVLDAFVQIRDEQELQVNVGVEAGAVDTEFHIASAEVSFPIVVPEEFAECRAVATVSVTDTGGGPGSFAMAVGVGPPGIGIFRAYYNGGPYTGGVLFSHLVGFVFAGSGGSASAFQADPPVGFRPVGADVWSLQTYSAFTLTPTDRCSLTTFMGFAAPEWCPGDLDLDGVVNVVDLGVLLSAFGSDTSNPEYFEDADFDRNGRVDLFDLSTLLRYIGSSCS